MDDPAATGEWADKPIRLYGPDAMSGTGRFFRHVVLNDSRMMNWPAYAEITDTRTTVDPTHDAGRQIIAALAVDRHGLAVASLDFATDQVRALPLVSGNGEGAVSPTDENLISRRYPLTRIVTACFNRKPDQPPPALVGEFLRFVLSEAGQQAFGRDEGYLPLNAAQTATEAHKID